MGDFFRQRPSTLDRTAFLQCQGRVYEHSPWIAETLWDAGLRAAHDEINALHSDLAAIVDAAPRARQLALLNAHPDLAGKLAVRGELTAAQAAEQGLFNLERARAMERLFLPLWQWAGQAAATSAQPASSFDWKLSR